MIYVSLLLDVVNVILSFIIINFLYKTYIDSKGRTLMEEKEVLEANNEENQIVFADPPDEDLKYEKTLEFIEDMEENIIEDIAETIGSKEEIESVMEKTNSAEGIESVVEETNNPGEIELVVEETSNLEEKQSMIEEVVIPQTINKEKIEIIKQMDNLEESIITIPNMSKEKVFLHSSLHNVDILETQQENLSRRRKLALKVGNIKGNK